MLGGLAKTYRHRKAIAKRILDKTVNHTKYGASWQKDVSNKWYEELFHRLPLVHKDFMEFFNQNRNDIHSVLEVGCGTGIYPIKHRELFSNISYTGVDISEPAIEYCKRNSDFNFYSGDFIKMESSAKYDLVFSHAVIDHVYDIDAFLSRLVETTNKLMYVSAYRGYFPDLDKHKMTWNNENGCYYNDLSVRQIRKTLERCGLEENEFVIRKQESGMELGQSYSRGIDGFETVISSQRK